MGCVRSIFFRNKNTTSKCIQQLNEIDAILKEMLLKYTRQKEQLEDDIKEQMRQKVDKSLLLHQAKHRKIVIHYMEKCRERIDTVMQRKYAVEQLNITAMQIEALQQTANAFKQFNKNNTIDKIDRLNETMTELTDQVLEINTTLGSEPLLEIDDNELMRELDEISTAPSFEEFPTVDTCESTPQPARLAAKEFPTVPTCELTPPRVSPQISSRIQLQL